MAQKNALEKMRERIFRMGPEGLRKMLEFADGLPETHQLAACEIRSAVLEALERRASKQERRRP